MSDHANLKARLEHLGMEPYLRHIRFPSYKSLEPGLRVEFTHPITALVGKNGTNKTSILRALQGCRDGQSPGRYWFGTNLDTIDSESRPRMIHGWRAGSTGEIVEALKERSPRKADPDYWEPAQPKQADAMIVPGDGEGILNSGPRARDGERSKDRWNAIDKQVTYLDFRSELSAFDKFFYHSNRDRSLRARRDLIRQTSRHIKEILQEKLTTKRWHRIERVVAPVDNLDSASIAAISGILERTYDQVEVLQHRFYGFDGTTARLKVGARQYSEAFAGSGEFAVISLVNAVQNAPPNSLLLLDEPEVSLHPGAQERLMSFLVEQCATHGHQVVLATHSPTIIQDLPEDAIKVLTVREDGAISLLSQSSTPIAAFETLGHSYAKPTVVVEDPLAREIVCAALRSDAAIAVQSVDVRIIAGGAEGLKRIAVDQSMTNTPRLGVLLDGDQRLAPSTTSDDVADTAIDLSIDSFAGPAVRKTLDGLAKTTPHDGPDLKRTFIDWWHQHVSFLPGSGNPEEWLAEMAYEQLSANKDYWVDLTRTELGLDAGENLDARSILETQRRAISEVDPAELQQIASDVRRTLNI